MAIFEYHSCTCAQVWHSVLPAPPCPVHSLWSYTFTAPSTVPLGIEPTYVGRHRKRDLRP